MRVDELREHLKDLPDEAEITVDCSTPHTALLVVGDGSGPGIRGIKIYKWIEPI